MPSNCEVVELGPRTDQPLLPDSFPEIESGMGPGAMDSVPGGLPNDPYAMAMGSVWYNLETHRPRPNFFAGADRECKGCGVKWKFLKGYDPACWNCGDDGTQTYSILNIGSD